MPFGWEGAKVRLVPLDKERHFHNCVRWLNDPEVTAWTLVGDLPLTRLAEERFFNRAAQTTRQPAWVVWAVETKVEPEEHVGVGGIHDINYRHGSGTIGLLIGRRQLWGRGLGGDALRTLTRYAFDVLGLRLLLADTFADNPRSLRLLRACGYQEVGRIAQRWWKRGAYRDAVLWALQREDWQAANQRAPAPP